MSWLKERDDLKKEITEAKKTKEKAERELRTAKKSRDQMVSVWPRGGRAMALYGHRIWGLVWRSRHCMALGYRSYGLCGAGNYVIIEPRGMMQREDIVFYSYRKLGMNRERNTI